MSSIKCTLRLDELICQKVTGEPGHDEIYFKIWVDGNYWGTYPRDADDSNTFDMNDSGDKYRKVALDLSLEYGDNVKIEVREQDSAGNASKDEIIGDFTIHTSQVNYGDISTHSNTVSGSKAEYTVKWRLLSQKIPTLRVLGISCQQSSCNSNVDVIDAVTALIAEVADKTAEYIGDLKTPKAKKISKAFEIAGETVQAIGKVYEWIANAAEGDDDVYIQQTFSGEQAHDGAGFCPPNGGVMKMNKGDTVAFLDSYDRYFRFPLDRDEVTIELREKDSAQHDVSLGSFTVGMKDYEELYDKGARVMVLTNFLDTQGGQGAIYHVCYSLALEDWSYSANQDAEA
ncbi:hypothetical protein L4D09_25280 [Photobacterium makurazakiensis]|uniref:hypothetical protein n=1 Tax=Photobacterium makurazakiensis TaxID=2910234 RepID=UPI003D096E39